MALFNFLKRLIGGEKAPDNEKTISTVRRLIPSEDEKRPSSGMNSFGEVERSQAERLEMISAEMPGGEYFKLLETLNNAISKERYADAAHAAQQSIAPLRKWLADPKGNGVRLQIRIPALQQGGTMMAITGNLMGLESIRDLVHEFEHLEAYRPDAAKHFKAIELFQRIRQLVLSKPGVLQNKMKAELGEVDGRQISNLISWLEKSGEISRIKSSNTHALFMTEALNEDQHSAAQETTVYTSAPKVVETTISSNPHTLLEGTYRFVALDVETANRQSSSICQVGLALVAASGQIETISLLVDPQQNFETFNVNLHGIDADSVQNAPVFKEILQMLRPFLERHVLVQHSNFDKQAFNAASKFYDIPELRATWVDSVQIARKAWPELKGNGGHGLANLKAHLSLVFEHHDAEEDARAAAEVVLLAEAATGEYFSELAKPKKQKYQTSVAILGNQNGALFGHVACFTGQLAMSRMEAAKFAAGAGITVKTGVSKQVTLLVVGDQDMSTLAGHNKSSKHRRAEELLREGHEIKILGETQFLELITIK